MTHSLEEANKIIDEQKDQLLEAERTIDGLKSQVDNDKRTKENLTTKLHEKNNKIKTLHETLNKESIIGLKFDKITSDLNNLLRQQRYSSDKI